MSTPTTPTTPVPAPRPAGAPWPIPEAAAFLAVSERHLYRLIDARKLTAVRLGRRRLVPDAEVQRLARAGC